MEADVTRNIEEQLSAFIDGELPEAELQMLIRRLGKDEHYRATLARYTLIGSIIRDEPAFVSLESVRTGVMSSLSNVESADSDLNQPEDISVSKDSAPAGSRGRVGSLLAASLAALGVFGVFQFSTNTPDLLNEKFATVVDSPAPDINAYPADTIPSGRINADRITSYMVSHGEFSRSFQGAMVDSRVFVQPASYRE